MSDTPKTLLPEGLRDLLPPEATLEADVVHRLAQSFSRNGYDLVKPPLIEFEDTLLAGVGTALRETIFRMPDPVSHRTLGLRADVTTQVARIAATRLAKAPRPLRLMYVGPVLRVRGDQLEPERQFTQAGIELIGAAADAADAEVIIATVEALQAVGVKDITVDLALPTLVPLILAGASGVEEARLKTGLFHKDIAEIKAAAGSASELLATLVESSGAWNAAVERVAKLNLPSAARAEWDRLVSVAKAVNAAAPDLALTIDAVESRGFEYHTGVTFSLFAKGAQREIGRGGRYQLSHGEPATGATLLVDALLGVVAAAAAEKRLWVPFDTARKTVRGYQAEGWVVVAGLEPGEKGPEESHRLGCGHYLAAGGKIEISSAPPASGFRSS